VAQPFNRLAEAEVEIRIDNERRWDTFSSLDDLVLNYYQRLASGLNRLAAGREVSTAAQLIWESLSTGRCIYVAGNGGSSLTAAHIATDLSMALNGCDGHPGSCGRIESLAEKVSLVTAIANDHNFDEVFARQVTALGKVADLLIVLSVSGRSRNIIRACEAARERGMEVLALLGNGGTVGALATVSVKTGDLNYGRAEDMHLSIGHVVASFVRQRHIELTPTTG
jgi:D-sedoheptulose 7-phosphate isomerase